MKEQPTRTYLEPIQTPSPQNGPDWPRKITGRCHNCGTTLWTYKEPHCGSCGSTDLHPSGGPQDFPDAVMAVGYRAQAAQLNAGPQEPTMKDTALRGILRHVKRSFQTGSLMTAARVNMPTDDGTFDRFTEADVDRLMEAPDAATHDPLRGLVEKWRKDVAALSVESPDSELVLLRCAAELEEALRG